MYDSYIPFIFLASNDQGKRNRAYYFKTVRLVVRADHSSLLACFRLSVLLVHHLIRRLLLRLPLLLLFLLLLLLWRVAAKTHQTLGRFPLHPGPECRPVQRQHGVERSEVEAHHTKVVPHLGDVDECEDEHLEQDETETDHSDRVAALCVHHFHDRRYLGRQHEPGDNWNERATRTNRGWRSDASINNQTLIWG